MLIPKSLSVKPPLPILTRQDLCYSKSGCCQLSQKISSDLTISVVYELPATELDTAHVDKPQFISQLRNEPLGWHCDYNWMETSNMSQMLNSDKCEQLSTIALVLNIGPSKTRSRVMKVELSGRFYFIQKLFEVRRVSHVSPVIMSCNDGTKTHGCGAPELWWVMGE